MNLLLAAVGPDSSAGAVLTVNNSLVLILTGFALPLVNGLLLRPTNPPWVKVLVASIVAVIAQWISQAVQADGSAVLSQEWALGLAVTIVGMIAAYVGIWKPVLDPNRVEPTMPVGDMLARLSRKAPLLLVAALAVAALAGVTATPAGAVEIPNSPYARDICHVLKHEFDTTNTTYETVRYRLDYYNPANPDPQYFHVRCLFGPKPGVWPNLGLLCSGYLTQVWPTTQFVSKVGPVPYRNANGTVSNICPPP